MAERLAIISRFQAWPAKARMGSSWLEMPGLPAGFTGCSLWVYCYTRNLPLTLAAEGIRRGLSTSNTPAGPTPAAAQNRTGSVLPSCLAYSDPSVGKQTRRRNGWGRIVQEGLLTLLPGAKSGNPLTGVKEKNEKNEFNTTGFYWGEAV